MINPNIFKAYDIRGVVPTDLNPAIAYRIGQAYTKFLKPKGKVAVGRDVRTHSLSLQKKVIQGLTDAGVDVIDIGLISTEELYFAVGYYELAGGIQITASHNSAEWNGMKMTREKAIPLSGDTGIQTIRDLILKNKETIKGDNKGKISKKDVLSDYIDFVLKFIKTKEIKPLKIAFNPNFGYEGEILKKAIVKGKLPLTLIGLNETPDGTFPKGKPDPLQQINRLEFAKFIKKNKVDFGVAWDADADRVFFYTGGGEFIEPYFMNTVFINFLLAGRPGEKIVYDPRYAWATLEAIERNHAVPILERVGHAYVKARMRETNAIFSGETSGHTYFRDFFFADCGLIPLLLVLEIISQKKQSLEQIIAPVFQKHFISGEINNLVADPAFSISKVQDRYSDAKLSFDDGLTIEYPDWRANLRISNTESLLRLNIEAKSQKLVNDVRYEILKIIRQ